MDLFAASEPRPLGRSGLVARPLAWNARPTSADGAARALAAVAEAGFGLVTVASLPAPGGREAPGTSEALLGEALAAVRPEGLLLAVRGGIRAGPVYDARAEALVAEVEASLARLRREVIDLFILQRADLLAHPAEVARAFAGLVASGKVRAVGVANHGASRLRALTSCLEVPLATIELPFSALEPAPLFDGMLDLALELGVATIASAPLAEGQLGDRPDAAASVTARATIRALDTIAGQQGVSRAAAAAAFVAVHPAQPIPLFGSQDPAELKGIAGMTSVRMARSDWYRVVEATLGSRLPALEADR
jgi:predicted oxidoreductase